MRKELKAVFSPHKYIPALIEQAAGFETYWQQNRHWVFCNFSHIAYFNKPQVEQFLTSLGAQTIKFYDRKGAQAYLAIWNDKAVLSFRGTQPIENNHSPARKAGLLRKFRLKHFLHLKIDPKSLLYFANDILADMRFKKTSFDDSRYTEVHRGFLCELDKIWDRIYNDIQTHAKELPIWATGHSLGGAMATLAGMRHCFEGVITFGEPRVGIHIDKEFRSKKHVRYINGDDPVTKIPPELIFGFDHHGEPIRICDNDGRTDFKYDHSIVYYSENLLSH